MKKEIVISENNNGRCSIKSEGFNIAEILGMLRYFETVTQLNMMESSKIDKEPVQEIKKSIQPEPEYKVEGIPESKRSMDIKAETDARIIKKQLAKTEKEKATAEAKAILESKLEMTTPKPNVKLMLGKVIELMAEKKWAEAVKHSKDVLGVDPKNEDAQRYLRNSESWIRRLKDLEEPSEETPKVKMTTEQIQEEHKAINKANQEAREIAYEVIVDNGMELDIDLIDEEPNSDNDIPLPI